MAGDFMVSVKDINNKRFEPVKNGYSTIEVDDYLKQCANSLKQVMAENDDLKQKLSILAESVRDFQKKEADITGALLDIQRTKRYAIEDAQTEAKRIIAEAHEQAKAILGNTSHKLRAEEKSYAEMKKQVASFKESILAMYKEHLSIFTSIPDEYDDYEEDAPAGTVSEPVHTEQDDDLPVSGAAFEASPAVDIPAPEESFMEPETTDEQTDLYNQAFGEKPVPGKSEKFDAIGFGQNS
jgi:cell division initiation protein